VTDGGLLTADILSELNMDFFPKDRAGMWAMTE
jgi:hypothetical protein